MKKILFNKQENFGNTQETTTAAQEQVGRLSMIWNRITSAWRVLTSSIFLVIVIRAEQLEGDVLLQDLKSKFSDIPEELVKLLQKGGMSIHKGTSTTLMSGGMSLEQLLGILIEATEKTTEIVLKQKSKERLESDIASPEVEAFLTKIKKNLGDK